MARTKETAAPEGAPKTTNELSDNQRHALFEHDLVKYSALLATKKKADKALRDFGKIIKADLGEYGLDMIKLRLKIEDGGAEAEASAKDHALNMIRVMRWAGLPVGHEDDLFQAIDPRPLDEVAFDEGKIAGMRGMAMTAPERFATGPTYQAWCNGWHKGQGEIFDIRPTAKQGDGTTH